MSLMIELVTFINRIPASPHIKRLRVAVTREELEQIKKEVVALRLNQGDESQAFFLALRGLPLEIDPVPTNPVYFVEPI